MSDHFSRIKKLIIALIASVAVNIVFFVLIFYWSVKERPPIPYCELKPISSLEQKSSATIDYSNAETIRYFKKMPFEWLVARLKDNQLLENGYTQRDLALACLVTFYDFDLQRALTGFAWSEHKRAVIYGQEKEGHSSEMIVYPGLSDKHFETLIDFAYRERWPITPRGIFHILVSAKMPELSLVDAFFITPEFLVVELLFNRSEMPVDKHLILQTLLEGDWNMLEQFVAQQKVSQDVSPNRRQQFLIDYIQKDSKSAASLLLTTDYDFAIRRLNDNQVIQLLQFLISKNQQTESFALAMLTSPRSDAVWKAAALKLYEYAGEPLPEKFQYQKALQRFAPQHLASQQAQPSQIEALKVPKPVDVPVAKVTSTPTSAPKKSEKPVAPPLPKKAVVDNKKPAQPQKSTTKAAKLTPATAPAPMPPLTPASRDCLYMVQNGDTLWILSRRFNIDVGVLKAYNRLDREELRLGMSLRIPIKPRP